MEQMEALRSMYNEAKQLMEFAHRLYCQEEADASEVEELDSMLSDCIDALTTLEETLTEEETSDEISDPAAIHELDRLLSSSRHWRYNRRRGWFLRRECDGTSV